METMDSSEINDTLGNQSKNTEADENKNRKADQPEFIIVMGGVCTGKTTLRHTKYANGYVNIDAGEIFIELSKGEYFDFPSHLEESMNHIGIEKMRNSILAKKNIVIEIIGTEYESVVELIELSEKINYASRVEYLECDINEAWQRNIKRDINSISAYYCEPYHIMWFKHIASAFYKLNLPPISREALPFNVQIPGQAPEDLYIRTYNPTQLLSDAAELPQLAGDKLFFKLDDYEHESLRGICFETGGEEGGYIFIYDKNNIIWAEPFSYFLRFNRYYYLVNLLLEKYGDRMVGFEFDFPKRYFKYVGSDEAFEKLEKFKTKFA